jgi:hypothetical protein
MLISGGGPGLVFLVSLSNVVSIGMGVSWLWRTLGVARGGDSILVPEGRSGEGWNSFALEFRAVVNFMKSSNGNGRNSSKSAKASFDGGDEFAGSNTF